MKEKSPLKVYHHITCHAKIWLFSRGQPQILFYFGLKTSPSFFDWLPQVYSITFSPLLRAPTPSSSTNFPNISFLQSISLFKVNLQHHLPKRAILIVDKSLIPRLPIFLSLQIVDQFTRWGFFSKAPPLQRKSLWIFSNLLATDLGITKRNKKQIGRLLKVLIQQSDSSSYWKAPRPFFNTENLKIIISPMYQYLKPFIA